MAPSSWHRGEMQARSALGLLAIVFGECLTLLLVSFTSPATLILLLPTAVYAVLLAYRVVSIPPAGCTKCLPPTPSSRTPDNHCSVCRVCSHLFSHHCAFLKVCIGAHNRSPFVQLLVCTSISALTAAICTFPWVPTALRQAFAGVDAPLVQRCRLAFLYTWHATAAFALVLLVLTLFHLWLFFTSRVPADVWAIAFDAMHNNYQGDDILANAI